MQKVDCKKYAEEILEKVKKERKKPLRIVRRNKGDAAADAYINGIEKDCARCGIECREDSMAHWRVYGDVVCDDPQASIIHSAIDCYKEGVFFPCVVEAVLYIMEMELDFIAGKKVLLISRSEALAMPLFNE